jgi:putative peptidoglycan lipid II flippase
MKKVSENLKVAKAAGVIGTATMVSRIFGLLRDIVIAAFFGAGWKTDAFWVAYRIPNMLRRLLGEGALTISFVPVFTEYLQKKTKQQSLELASVVFTLLSIILAIITLAGIIFSPLIVGLIAPGFINEPEQFALAVFLNRLMFPYIFFISLVALCMGILNSFRHFSAPALSPVMLNVAMIASAFLLKDYFAEPITALAIGVLIGGFLQLIMQWPFLVKYGVKFRIKFDLRHPGLKQIGYLFMPAMFSASVNTLNIFVGTILASLLPSGSLTYLFYADRVMELPIGVFAIAMGTATLPSFSRHATDNNTSELKTSLSFSLRLMLFLIIPAMVALMTLNQPIISVLFQRGAFDATASLLTGQALFCYALGLWAFAVVRIFLSAFYSLQDSKWPMKAAFISFAVNIVASVILMYPLKHNGLALANSLAVTVNVFVLAAALKKKIGTFLDKEFYFAILKIIMASLIMLAAIVLLSIYHPWNMAADFKEKLLYLFLTISVGGMVFLVSAYLLKIPEAKKTINLIKQRFRPPQS